MTHGDKMEAMLEFAYGEPPSSFRDFLKLAEIYDEDLFFERDKLDNFPFEILNRKKEPALIYPDKTADVLENRSCSKQSTAHSEIV